MTSRKTTYRALAALLCLTTGLFAGEPGQTPHYLKAQADVVRRWRDMRFGMFLCWGPVSLTGREIGWSRGEPAWGIRPGVRGGKGPTPIDVYDHLYKRWKPDAFDAEAWVRTAKAAGMKYMIFLVKHHDGFCLYDTQLTDYKSTGAESAWPVDVMKHVADACHKHDLGLMIYYSQPDWHHPDYLGECHERYVEYLHGQVRELLTHYGRIDGLWFDNLRPVHPETAKLWDAEQLFQMARSIQPHLIINNRCGLPGDYDTPEQSLGKFEFERPWESCVTLGTQWSWKPDDSIKPLKECIDILVTCAGRGGNLALNTNPMPNGQIEPRQARRFLQIGQWLDTYGESIYGTRGGPCVTSAWGTRFGHTNRQTRRVTRPWGVTTRKGNVLYVHILNTDTDAVDLPPIGRQVLSYRTLGDDRTTVSQDAEGIHIAVTERAPDALDTVVRIELDGSIDDVAPIDVRPKSLVSGGRASASGLWPQPRLEAKYAFDGDPDTRWGGPPHSTSGWIAIDMGREETFDRVWISEAYDRVRQFEIQVQAHGQWETFYTGDRVGTDFEASFQPVTARHVRLNIIDATDVPTIWEFQLFEPDNK
ncbi:MAG: alpha-L-fucosidase [Sedimentisphaerales bacterium]|nr:alpha-L-fucosidase [Sedimentisphaerales bacterium]